ncbi:MAG: tRNA (cytidine(34)-2'-O)-methyltransferase [Bdellovibrionaceae bacterium]|jgi:tRNA (cytidine/uridine-2'-O-)-methyltransferase|nr:tRNA (cytidine(34)-2'-O)-methyltransferase [Pseudobdellovibrionaceae bacterium]
MNDYDPIFNVVLLEPEIPSNTGNIGRTCVGTQSMLHLVKPYAFELTDKRLKRAGLDYWPNLKWQTYENLEELMSKVPDQSRVFYLTTKTQQTIYDVQFQKGDWLVFGKETKGLPEELLELHKENCLTIPMAGPVRSFNLSNAACVTVFEGVRQLNLQS